MEDNWYVPASQVLPFNFIKKPIISAIWYSALSVLLIENQTVSFIVGFVFLALSFTQARFYLAIGSILPMIAVVVLCFTQKTQSFAIAAAAVAIIWFVCWIIALTVTLKLAKGDYEIMPVSNKMRYSLSYMLKKGLQK